MSSKQNPKTKRLTERKNLTKNLQNATTKSYTAKGKNKSQKPANCNNNHMTPLKHKKKKLKDLQKATRNPGTQRKDKKRFTQMQNATNPAATQRKKNQAHKPDQKMQQIMHNPEGKKNPPSQICKMQHYDHATNQPHNPATKCNNKLKQPKGRKRTFPHKSAKCNIIIQQIMHPKRKPNTQNHAIQRVGKKSS